MTGAKECAACRRQGHFCPAVITVETEDGREPSCLECAEGETCVTLRVGGKGRENSSVAPTPADLGELRFDEPAAPPPVVHRTPEELGIPRTVKAEPEPLRGEAKREAFNAAIEEMGRWKRPGWKHADAAKAAACEAKQENEERKMPTGKYGARTPDDVREKIVAEGYAASGRELAQKYGVSEATIHAVRAQAGMRKTAAAKPGRKAKAGAAARSIPVDPGRNGSAAALVRALDKLDAERELIRVTIELTRGELGQVLAGLTDAQRQAFSNEGMRAALTAPAAN